jgi:uncharacterized membrane protein YoaK (UPF0700 family)
VRPMSIGLEERPRRAGVRGQTVARWAMLTLSFSTGVLDAATYLGLHGVFTANMTGNLIFVSLGLAGQASVPVLRAVLALGGFALGAAVSGRLLRGGASSAQADRRLPSTLLLVAMLLAGSAVTLAVGGRGALLLDVLTVLMAFAMGVQAMVARRVGVGDVTTVVVTSTLAGLMGENSATGRTADRALTVRRALAVLTMALGAVTGAFLLSLSIVVAVALSSLLILVGAGALVLGGRVHVS